MLSWSSHHLNQCTRICVTRTGASPLVLPRSRTHAALPETSSGGDAVRPHPVTRNENRRTRSTWVLARRTVSGSRSASDGRLGHYLTECWTARRDRECTRCAPTPRADGYSNAL